MNTSLIWLVIKALFAILPAVVSAVRDGRIRAASQTEVLDALSVALQERFDAARRAADGDTDELSDPNNRAGSTFKQPDPSATVPSDQQ